MDKCKLYINDEPIGDVREIEQWTDQSDVTTARGQWRRRGREFLSVGFSPFVNARPATAFVGTVVAVKLRTVPADVGEASMEIVVPQCHVDHASPNLISGEILRVEPSPSEPAVEVSLESLRKLCSGAGEDGGVRFNQEGGFILRPSEN